ncbi:MAG: capsular biosynthesis protein [Bacteroidetes bacterium]|nr:capsular biosynthesis protein [Bacteroidota bacterium]MDA0903913.1 capsular biosynthesis protein [Bacteroidota bacterium]MDA1242759.1 capsular biosynthesis protein [Bacteroidota bacterium]
MPIRWPWKRTDEIAIEWRELGWDIHSHLAPGVDDGATNVDEALDMVRGMSALGYRGMVITPHIMADLYPNNPETLRPAFAKLQQAVSDLDIHMELQLAAEYHMDHEFMALLPEGELMTIPWEYEGNHKTLVLVEFGFHQAPEQAMVEEVLFTLQTRGITPLLAHCERYPYLHRNDNLLRMWFDRGGWLSINAASLVGAYGPETKEMAERAMQAGWVSFLCTDAHGMRHVHAMASLVRSKIVKQWLESGHSKHAGLGVRPKI